MEYRAKLIGTASLLLCVAFASQALTLGRIRGAALIGQPLSMVVPVQMDAGEDASATCFEAEVFHADLRQDPGRVKLTVEPSGQAGTLNVRISSTAIVDEPMVTLYLRTVCGQKTTRRYVLLADLPSEVDPVAPIRIPSAPAIPSPVGVPAPVASSEMANTNSPAVARAPAPVAQAKAPVKPKPKVVKKAVAKPVNKVPEAKSAAAPAAPVAAVAPVAPSGQPRLTLEPPVLLPEQVDALAPAPLPNPTADAQRDLLKIQTLESDVKALLALAAKNEASLLDLRTRLQMAESERLPNWMVYALGALVLACLAAIAVLLARQRRADPKDNDHWSASVAAAMPPNMPESGAGEAGKGITMPGLLDSKPLASSELSVPVRPAPTARQADAPVTQVDVSLLEMSESSFDKLMQSGTAHSAIRKPSSQPVAPVAADHQARNLNSASVFDVRQQAEFFVSLGQTDQAVRILEKQISDSQEPNPHVYLDLLAIFHSLSLKVDFRQFREDFNLLFNGRVPEFASFKDEGQDLEAYPAAVAAISAVWPSAKALTILESFIFRDPRETSSQPFDLVAFRDLLLLHAVVQRIVVASPGIVPAGESSAASAQARPYFADSGLGMPLPMPSPYAPSTAVPDYPAMPGLQEIDLDLDLDLDDLGLDLDLSDAPAPSAALGALQDISMDLDLSLPASAPMDLELPDATTPVSANLIDFDMSEPFQRPKSDDQSPG